MNEPRGAALYTPELLALATRLASFPLDGVSGRTGSARSTTCGSTLKIGLDLDPSNRIARVAMRATACAVGQAAAAIFAEGALSLGRAEVETARHAITQWLDGSGRLPEWPQFALLEAAREYPSRHGAILLPWIAAIDALCNETASS